MKSICNNCGKKYKKKKYAKTDLCKKCYKEKIKILDRERKRLKNEETKPFIKRIDETIRPYVIKLIDAGYTIIDASPSYIIFLGKIDFETMPQNWLYEYDINKNITKIYSNEEKERLIKLGVWIYHNIDHKNSKKFL